MKKWLLGFFALVTTAYIGAFLADVTSDPVQQTVAAPKTSKVEVEQITTDGLFEAINTIRTRNNLAPFSRNALLDKSSGLKCDDMVKGNYYGHEHPVNGKPGVTYAQDIGARYQRISENLNKGTFSTKEMVIGSWMTSEPHKKSILTPNYTEIGFAICTQDPASSEILVVQHKIEPLTQ